MLEAELVENRAIIRGKKAFQVYDESNFGKPLEDSLELSLIESAFLLGKNRIKVFKGEGENKVFLNEDDMIRYGKENERNFHARLVVYSDLRERGFVVKTGLKFGCDFRVYDRGVKIKRGPKSPHEHTRWVVHAIPEEFSCSFPELSRAVRLAQNIRTEMIWAVVDNENDVTYFKITRITP